MAKGSAVTLGPIGKEKTRRGTLGAVTEAEAALGPRFGSASVLVLDRLSVEVAPWIIPGLVVVVVVQ
jgi:hypothetical protein